MVSRLARSSCATSRSASSHRAAPFLDGRTKILKPYRASDLLILDEFGYLPADPDIGPILYEVIATRYEKKATIITSNKSLTEWGRVLHDSALAAALVDRLLHHGEVYYLKGDSYRLRGKPRSAEPRASYPRTREKKWRIDSENFQLTDAQRAGIEAVAMDMWEPYVQSVFTHLPGGENKIVFDRFDIMGHMGDAVDRVRKQEHRALRPATRR